MERMFNECLPAASGRIPRNQYEESDGENSGYGDDHFRDGRGGGRHGGRDDRRAGGDHERGRRVHFDDEEEFQGNSDEESDFNPFANRGRFGRDHDHRCDGGDDGEQRCGHHRNDPNNIARVKLSIPKSSGKEDANAYLEWEEQCDQIFKVHNLSDQKCVNLASVEFSGYALTWWNQLQRNQLDLGRNHIDTWAEMKRVMRRCFVPSSHQHDIRNRLQILKQGSKSVGDYFKEMELLLIRLGIREDEESKMARFLHGLNTKISDFVEMFPYHNLQDLVDQAMRTERKIQQEGRGRSYGNRSVSAPWHRQHPGTSVGGGRSQGAATRPSPSIGASKTVASTASSPAIQRDNRRPATSVAVPSIASATASSLHSQSIVCHKCQGRGHVAAECPSRRTMIVNDKGEWESESEPEDEGPKYDEEILENENEIQPDEGDNNCLSLVVCLVFPLQKKRMNNGIIFFTPVA
jgi:hypothetical protein